MTRFQEDLCLGKETLMQSFPSLYNLVRKKNANRAQMFSTIPLNVSFRRALVGDNLIHQMNLVRRVMLVQLNDRQNSFVWTKSKSFSIQPIYTDLLKESGIPAKCPAWRIKVPLKIKVFLWNLQLGVILTKDNLAKRKQKCTRCCFCNVEENIQHLFFLLPNGLNGLGLCKCHIWF